MYHDGVWDDNEYTADGRYVHRRVDEKPEVIPGGNSESGDDAPIISRSVMLGSEELGITAKLDLVEREGGKAIPVETKRSKVPGNELKSWEPERVQLMAQGLLLREAGYQCDHGIIYYAGSRTRVDILFTPELERRTLYLLDETHSILMEEQIPPPLVDDPKCKGCSIAGICLPDETHLLLMEQARKGETNEETGVRRFFPAKDDALPLYIQEQGAMVGKEQEGFKVSKGKEKIGNFRLIDINQIVLCGNIGITAQAIHLACENTIPIVHLSMGNWFYGITQGIGLKNSFNRSKQFAVAENIPLSLKLAKSFVYAKCSNQRTMLRRNSRGANKIHLKSMATQIGGIDGAPNMETLLGVEGNIAATYFGHFQSMLKTNSAVGDFEWTKRNRRPPRDPINAMLSFGYALLSKECTIALMSVGLDPYWGFYHKPRHGRPALSLDLMEEFRALIVDSAVISAINTGMVKVNDFIVSNTGCIMKPGARKAFIKAYEARLEQLVTHPLFDYRCSYRRIIMIQAQLLSRFLREELPEYTGFTTR